MPPVDDCLRQLESFGVFDSTWNVILTILVPARGFQHRVSKRELKAIRRLQDRTTDYAGKPQAGTDCSRFDHITFDAVFKGKTDRIRKGAVVLATICFADHWPTEEEFRKMEKRSRKKSKISAKKKKGAKIWKICR